MRDDPHPAPAPLTAQVTLIHGDCLLLMRNLPPGSVDCILTDPPYGIDYRSKPRAYRDDWKLRIANDRAPFIWWLFEAFRVLRDGGCLACFCRWDVEEVFRSAIRTAGFAVKSQVIWDKGVHGQGDTRAAFGPRHENLVFAVKGRFAFPGGRPPSVLRVNRVGGRSLVHPAEKPVELLALLIRHLTREGDLVLDPFLGSGATAVAALRLGRRGLGMELDAGDLETAARRVASTEPGGRAYGVAAPGAT